VASETNLQEVIFKWKSGWRGRGTSSSATDEKNLTTDILNAIAEGLPVSTTALEERTGLDFDEVDGIFDRMRGAGSEFNADGHLVGNVLTQIPTPHHFNIDGKELYAWCALDTLFLPGLMGRTAEVESTCPATGQGIRLTVAPNHIDSSSPDGIVVSIIIPGEADGTGQGSVSGPQCAT
jgi:alkylmercury lyase